MQVSVIRLSNLTQSDFNSAIHHVSIEVANRIKRFVHKEDAERTLIAHILIRTLLSTMLRIPNHELILDKNAYGKPYLVGNPNVHFNISHSGEWIMCAIDHAPIGVDVERIQPIELNISEQFFSVDENADLFAQPEHHRLAYFYDLWTLKESYIKTVGMGLSIPLDSFSIRMRDNEILFQCEGNLSEYYFNQYHIDSNYKFSVCAMHNRFVERVEILVWDAVLETFKNSCI